MFYHIQVLKNYGVSRMSICWSIHLLVHLSLAFYLAHHNSVTIWDVLMKLYSSVYEVELSYVTLTLYALAKQGQGHIMSRYGITCECALFYTFCTCIICPKWHYTQVRVLD